ncbi:heme o synthase [Aetokthonos hydrillicola Thurmond2011]|jgi:protoheme IX farnesyltransferase|uniref:Protoheme IX farnesyltransferase n=1 Tax=Aetokthonos hydrillicola Thurmond2011 TaxID=2712845 RepID=A0AAP5IFU6_9CYAN|nr:heme o synthase [Aetokthonos hydrillicola]MBW4589292.1 heme o synthase [Aetokthonos hydrillicola CCALA 1050]MDR9900938.1 heme o synthase [Aetokthonos hydrillicola Thurmond2011]
MIETNVSRHHGTFLQVIHSYYQLTKPRIIPLLLITTAGSMWIAAKGQVDPLLLLVTLTGGTLAAASAQTINCVYDRDIDYDMERTRHRPLPSGRVQPRDALIFASVLAVLSFTLLTVFANLLAALLAMSGIVFYVLIYTHLLKRHSTQNIVIGGAAGAVPALVGWAAVTGTLSWAAWLIFAIVFLWTPPHFWALALMIQDDYAKVGVPMLPVVEGSKTTVQQIWIYTLVTVAATLLLIYPLQVSGIVYGAIALSLGSVFIYKAWQLLQYPEERNVARGLFLYSISYMMLLCLGMVIDSLPLTRHVIGVVVDKFHLLIG